MRNQRQGTRGNKRTTTAQKRYRSGGTDTSSFTLTKHDVSVASGPLQKDWQAFVAKPDDATAEAVAKALEKLSPRLALASVQSIAETLAERPALERSAMSRLIASRLSGDAARGFLKASAAVRLTRPATETPKTPEKPEEQPAPQHEDLLHGLDLLPPKTLGGLPAKTSHGRDRQQIEALDLASDKITADLAGFEQRTDEVRDISAMGHLTEALQLINSLGGTAGYSEQRRADLASKVKGTTQEHLVEQIGFRAAKTQRTDKSGLSPQNQLAASYWRTNFRDNLGDLLQRLQKNGKPGPGDLLVNSPRVLRKLEMMVGPEVVAGLTIEPLAGTSGISVLSGTGNHPSIDWNSILQELGATPSAYQLYELMDAGKAPPPTDYTVDTRADLAELITSGPFSRLQEIARGKSELAPVCAMIEHLVLGLTDELGPSRYDALTANALNSLSWLLGIVVQNERNPSVAMRAVDLMMDELGIVVAVAKNYTRTDYQDTMRQVLLERAPGIAPLVDKEQVQLNSHLMTSGMDALGTALSIALSSRDHDQVKRPTADIDYFETGLLLSKLKKGQVVRPRNDVLVAALNPSTPFDAPSADKLVADVREELKTRKKGDPPFALILDTTIEVAPRSPDGRTQLDVVLDGLKDAVAAGTLEVFCCKSFQKYASFGTGKVAAGDLTLLSKKGNLASASARAETLLQDRALDLARGDELQFVVHMFKHGHRDELALIRSAAGNAEFVDGFCWPINGEDRKQGSTYVDGIPLLLRAPIKADDLFKKLVTIDQRDSFSFLRTSYVGGIPGPYGADKPEEKWYVRINTGHEPKQAMVENFYAFGHLESDTLPGEKRSDGKVDLDRLDIAMVRKHLKALDLAQGDPDIARYRNSIRASYCAFAAQNLRPKTKALPELRDFFATPAPDVTIETQRYLAGELLSLAVMPGTILDRPLLAALARAAVLLPAWEFEPIAEKLNGKLKQADKSPEAMKLRAIVDRALEQPAPLVL
ncbi:hypothetical protein [Nonomuraea jabiensis]|uniref:hypothetical protein n=1 Tax=Nonomuraea jabiensis TaxID=882448 RepID=UPI003D749188